MWFQTAFLKGVEITILAISSLNCWIGETRIQNQPLWKLGRFGLFLTLKINPKTYVSQDFHPQAVKNKPKA